MSQVKRSFQSKTMRGKSSMIFSLFGAFPKTNWLLLPKGSSTTIRSSTMLLARTRNRSWAFRSESSWVSLRKRCSSCQMKKMPPSISLTWEDSAKASLKRKREWSILVRHLFSDYAVSKTQSKKKSYQKPLKVKKTKRFKLECKRASSVRKRRRRLL